MAELNEADIRTLLDKAQIHEALMRYSRGVDRGDGELVMSVFAPDATLDYGRGPMAPAALAEGITKMTATGAMHFIGNEYVEVDGETAYSETYFISYATVTGEEAPATRSRGGRYLDRFDRRDGEWKITRRVLVDEWSRLDELPAPIAPPPGRVGLRSKDDPVYVFRASGGDKA
ncbi:MAG TPA: nuclear transport factor 2 family protein [Streptosporangiaceae bacterium]|nr:nuclear transport factor 2 family protein [Streptosporangiaceae bacterium]